MSGIVNSATGSRTRDMGQVLGFCPPVAPNLAAGRAPRATKGKAPQWPGEAEPEEARVRVLLPGQKKPKQRRTTPEFVPVEKARRFEDGLPVYKSYGDFTDMRHGQEGAGVDGKGRKLGPNGEPAGDCPFDCWCCF